MAQTVEIPELREIISISFDRRGEKTVKDVTFLADDGYAYTQEVVEFSILEGTIRWVPYGEGSSLIQSRGPSRLFHYAVDLELPENCKRIVNVDVGYDSKNERVKNLVYLTNDGRIMTKEYFEGFLDRHFGGYMEVKGNRKRRGVRREAGRHRN